MEREWTGLADGLNVGVRARGNPSFLLSSWVKGLPFIDMGKTEEKLACVQIEFHLDIRLRCQ